MQAIEDILRAYAEVDQRALKKVGEVNAAPGVMTKITSGEQPMKPLWQCQLKKLLGGGGAVGLTVLAILALNFSLFMMDRRGALELINFGPNGIPAIATTLPYDFLALTLLASLAGFACLRRFDLTTQHSHLRLSVLYAVLVVGLALSFSVTGLNEAMLTLNPTGRSLVDDLAQHYLNRFQYQLDENHAIIGRIVKSSATEILVETPLKTMIKLDQAAAQNYPKQTFFTEGQIIKALGWREGDTFHVSVADTAGLKGFNFFDNPASPAVQLIPLP